MFWGWWLPGVTQFLWKQIKFKHKFDKHVFEQNNMLHLKCTHSLLSDVIPKQHDHLYNAGCSISNNASADFHSYSWNVQLEQIPVSVSNVSAHVARNNVKQNTELLLTHTPTHKSTVFNLL